MTKSYSTVASKPLDIAERIAQSATPLDYKKIIDSISDDVDVVMIGEASHGTHEFYHHRAEISKLLILEKGFNIIGLEADFPDTERVNQYVINSKLNKSKNAAQSLGEYGRFPKWMWRNTVMVNFVEWLRLQNTSSAEKCEIFGMDVYSLESSRDAVLAFLDKYDPELPGLLEIAEDAYLRTSKRKANPARADRVIKALERYLEKFPHFDELFTAVQNAKCVKGAAEYYTAENSWNHRDTFMFQTVKRVMDRRTKVKGERAKTIIWAHNSHVGDSRHTHKQNRGEITVGYLIREHWGLNKTVNIGFTTNNGFVTASDEWDSPCTYKKVNNGMNGSIEELLHKAVHLTPGQFMNGELMVMFRSTASIKNLANPSVTEDLGKHFYLERAIGVIYRPQTERWSHYFECRIAKQFDIVIHIDKTSALHPLDIPEEWSHNKRFFNSN